MDTTPSLCASGCGFRQPEHREHVLEVLQGRGREAQSVGAGRRRRAGRAVGAGRPVAGGHARRARGRGVGLGGRPAEPAATPAAPAPAVTPAAPAAETAVTPAPPAFVTPAAPVQASASAATPAAPPRPRWRRRRPRSAPRPTRRRRAYPGRPTAAGPATRRSACRLQVQVRVRVLRRAPSRRGAECGIDFKASGKKLLAKQNSTIAPSKMETFRGGRARFLLPPHRPSRRGRAAGSSFWRGLLCLENCERSN